MYYVVRQVLRSDSQKHMLERIPPMSRRTPDAYWKLDRRFGPRHWAVVMATRAMTFGMSVSVEKRGCQYEPHTGSRSHIVDFL